MGGSQGWPTLLVPTQPHLAISPLAAVDWHYLWLSCGGGLGHCWPGLSLSSSRASSMLGQSSPMLSFLPPVPEIYLKASW